LSELSLLSDHHGHHGHSHGPPLPVPGDPLELNEVPTSQKDHIVRVVALESQLCRAPLNENNSTQLTTIESTRLSASRSTISASLGCSFTSVATPLIVCYRPMHSPRSTGSLELTSNFFLDVGVIIAAIIMMKTSSPTRFYADPAVSLAISLIIFGSAVPMSKYLYVRRF